jgi:hypothetical protein
MSREVRRVPRDWEHPKDESGHFKPLHEGYAQRLSEFEDMQHDKGLQATLDYFGVAPNSDDYMPEWSEEAKTHYQMYETCTEGTPISPPMESPEKLARWLADNGASSFGLMTATYEQWLRVCNGGYAPSAIVTGGVLRSGVEGV